MQADNTELLSGELKLGYPLLGHPYIWATLENHTALSTY